MLVDYKLKQKGNPAKAGALEKFYATAISRGRIFVKEISRVISEILLLNYDNLSKVLNNFVLLIPEYLTNGNLVSLIEPGNLRLNFGNEGAEILASFTPSKFRSVKFCFYLMIK